MKRPAMAVCFGKKTGDEKRTGLPFVDNARLVSVLSGRSTVKGIVAHKKRSIISKESVYIRDGGVYKNSDKISGLEEETHMIDSVDVRIKNALVFDLMNRMKNESGMSLVRVCETLGIKVFAMDYMEELMIWKSVCPGIKNAREIFEIECASNGVGEIDSKILLNQCAVTSDDLDRLLPSKTELESYEAWLEKYGTTRFRELLFYVRNRKSPLNCVKFSVFLMLFESDHWRYHDGEIITKFYSLMDEPRNREKKKKILSIAMSITTLEIVDAFYLRQFIELPGKYVTVYEGLTGRGFHCG